MMTGSGKIVEESVLFMTRIQNIFCRPTLQDWLIFPILLPSSFGALMIFFWLASLDWIEKNEYIFLFALWFWLIILSIILIRGIYTDDYFFIFLLDCYVTISMNYCFLFFNRNQGSKTIRKACGFYVGKIYQNFKARI